MQFGDRFVSLNNRRILRAKYARETSVPCRVHQPTDPIDSRTALDEYGLCVAWMSEPDAFSGVVFPLTWGAAAVGRCAYQHVQPFLSRDAVEGSAVPDLEITTFPLHGSLVLPQCIGDNIYPPRTRPLRPTFVLEHGERDNVDILTVVQSLRLCGRVYVTPRVFTQDFRALRGEDFVEHLLDSSAFKWDAAARSREASFLPRAMADVDPFGENYDTDSDPESEVVSC